MAKDRQIVLTSTLVVGVALIHPVTDALAQNITLDASLGIAATLTGPNYVIPQSVGQTVGNNLFHSFGKFNLTANEAAIFQSADNIRNILSRVTDGSPSSIDGLIRTLGSDVNFFLINPSGMIFGQNARLDVSGSFVASTANAIKFGNQGFFNTTTPEVPSPLLTVNPSALFFNQLQVGRIENKSIAPAGDNLFGLRVPDGRSLLLVGGDIASNGGRLNAPGGRVELAGVAGVGTVGLNVDGKNLSLSVPENLGLADINFTNQSLINTSSDGSGGIRMWGRSIYFSERSSAIAHTQGSLDGEDIEMQSQQFKLEDSSYISASTFGTGKSGNLLIYANKSVELTGPGFAQNINKRRLQVFAGTLNPLDQQGGLFVSTIGRGKVGNIRIETENLSLKNGALIFSSTFGQEAGGNLNFSVSKSLEVIGSAIFSGTQRGTTGAGGKIAIDTGKLIIRDGGLVSNATFGSGPAGTLLVNASDSVEIDVNGQVSINTLEVNPSHGLVQLPSNLVDASQQIASSCTPREGQNTSRFIATGRSGLPLSPYEPLRGQTAIAGWVNLPQEITQTLTERSPAEIVDKNSIKSHFVEAQGWIVDTNGDVILMVRSPQMTSSMLSPVFCNQ